MTSTKHPEALRLVEQYDYGDPVAHSNTWKTAVCNELRRLHAENATLKAGYDATQLEIDHLRGATTMVELAQPVGAYPSLPAKQALYVFRGKDGGREEVHGYDELQMWGFVDADRAMRAKAAPAAAAGPSETVKFVDESTADPVEKARRYLKAMGDQRMNSAYFFDDGYPRQEISQDALATMAVLEQLAAAPTTQAAPQQDVLKREAL